MKIYIKSAVNPLSSLPDDIRREIAKDTNTTEDLLSELSSDPDWRTRRYANNHTNMSTDQLSEMARSKDGKVRREAALSTKTPVEVLETLVYDRAPRVRIALAKNPNTTFEMLETLVQDKDEFVRRAAISHPNAAKLVSRLYTTEDSAIRQSIAANPDTDPKILEKMVDLEPLLVASNLSTPISALKKLSKSKSGYVLAAVAANPNTPTEILDDISNLSIEEYPGIWYKLIANPNTSRKALQKLAKSGYRGLEYAAKSRLIRRR